MEFRIEPEVFKRWPDFLAGFLLVKEIEVKPADEISRKAMEECCGKVRKKWGGVEQLKKNSHTIAYEKFAESMGLEKKNLFLADQQIRRCLQGRPLNSINNAVDAYFKQELWHNLSIGAHDLAAIEEFYSFGLAKPGDVYRVIGGNDHQAKPGELMARDRQGLIYSLSGGDTERTKVLPGKRSVLIRIDAAPGISRGAVESCLKDIAQEFKKGEIIVLNKNKKEVSIKMTEWSKAPEQTTATILEKVIIGKILKMERPPNAKALWQVDVQVDSQGKVEQIACGADNIAEGQIVPVVLPGGVIYGKNSKPKPVGITEIRGVRSHGIICTTGELGIGDEWDDECILPADWESRIGEDITPYLSKIPVLAKEKKVVIKPAVDPLKVIRQVDKEGIAWTIKEALSEAFNKVASKKIIKPEEVSLEHPSLAEHGDYSSNLALKFFEGFHPVGGETPSGIRTPLDLANAVINVIRSAGLPTYLAKIDVAAPGFINMALAADYLITQASDVIKRSDDYGSSRILKGKKFLLEHTSPNPQTTIMLGHLKNNFLGMTTARLLESARAKVVKDCIVNDRGVHLCRAIYGYLLFAQKRGGFKKSQIPNFKKLTDKQIINLSAKSDWPELLNQWSKQKSGWYQPKDLKLKPDHANLIWYVLGSRAYDLSERVRQEVEEILLAWEAEDKKVWQIWQQILGWSSKGYADTYKRVGSVHDWVWHESDHYKQGKKIVEEGLRKKVFRKSQGAIVSDLVGYGLPDTVVVKADGTALYITQDLALTKLKIKKFPADLYIWDIGAEQTLYFKQLFAICEQLGIAKREKLYHLSYALINFKGGGKMATRKGDVVMADEILDDLHQRALEIIKSSNQELRGKLSRKALSDLAEDVAIGAIKYSLLKFGRETTIYFDPEESLSLEGNSGPYLQYTFARCQSVLAKAETITPRMVIGWIRPNGKIPEELALLRTIYKFPEVVWEARENFAPNLICNYLYDLAQKYNLFYNSLPILKAPTDKQRQLRLLLTAATGQILKNGLNLLGITTPERM